MGYRLLDQYSLLHFATGVVLYFWNIPFVVALAGHMLFEFFENTKSGMNFINTYFIHPGYFSWPGGKNQADSALNQFGDNLTFAAGWLISAYIDVTGMKKGWFEP